VSLGVQGRPAVVTGAASGIGRALAVELSRRGAHLALSDIDVAGLEDTARACRGAARSALVELYELDVSDRAAVVQHAREVADALGPPALVINNAGVAVAGSVADTPFEDIDWLLGINLLGVINGSKAFLPHLVVSAGHLVNISSVFGLVAPPYQSAYSTAKFGVRAFTESLRQEMLVAGLPVGVHCVHPGGVRTSIAANARYHITGAGDPVSTFDRVARTTPEKAAGVILRGVERGRARILVGADAHLIELASRLLGPGYMGIVARAARGSRWPG